MSFLNQPWPYIVTAVLVAWMGIYAWEQPHRPGTRYFGWIVVLWLIWALAATLETITLPSYLHYAAWVVQVFFGLLASPIELLFALEYTGNEKWLARRSLILLVIPAFLFGLLAIFLPRSDLASISVRAGVEVITARDSLRWVMFSFNFSIWLVNLWVLVNCMQRAPAYSAPIVLIILGQVIPRVTFAMINPESITISVIQATILATNFTALAYIIALYNFHLLNVVPIARDIVIDTIPYSMLVLDAENKLVGFNSAAQALPGLPGQLALSQSADRALGYWWARIAALVGPNPISQDLIFQTSPIEQIFHVFSLPLRQASGWQIGQVVILDDVTQARHVQRQQAHTLWVQATLQEREQLANELHDGVSQTLAYLNLQAQTAQAYLQTGQIEAAQEKLDLLIDAAVEIQDDTRMMISNLLSVSLQTENFIEALNQMLDRFEQQTGLETCLSVIEESTSRIGIFTDPGVFPPSIAVQLLRIAQEALANIYKHALSTTSQVNIRLKAGKEDVVLVIADDGEGFDPSTLRNNGQHFGLQVMRQRSERVGGQLSINSMPGEGTHIQVRVPLADNLMGAINANSSGR